MRKTLDVAPKPGGDVGSALLSLHVVAVGFRPARGKARLHAHGRQDLGIATPGLGQSVAAQAEARRRLGRAGGWRGRSEGRGWQERSSPPGRRRRSGDGTGSRRRDRSAATAGRRRRRGRSRRGRRAAYRGPAGAGGRHPERHPGGARAPRCRRRVRSESSSSAAPTRASTRARRSQAGPGRRRACQARTQSPTRVGTERLGMTRS